MGSVSSLREQFFSVRIDLEKSDKFTAGFSAEGNLAKL